MPTSENAPVTFSQLQKSYTALKDRFLSGAVSDADFNQACSLLELQDEAGERWRIEPYSGTWQRLVDGQWRHEIPPSARPAGDTWGETSLRLAIGRDFSEWSHGDDGELPPDSGIDDDFMGKCNGRILGGAE